MQDERDILLKEKPFACRLIKDDKARISYRGKPVSVICGKDYNKLLRVLALDNAFELQLFLAKITGEFKHGNER